MYYVIQKTLYGKWTYWLDYSLNWNGLRGNAYVFSGKEGNVHFDKQKVKAKKNEVVSLVRTYKNIRG